MSTRLTRVLAVVSTLSLGAGFVWAESVRVAGSAVKLRQGPGTSAPVTAVLARGEALEVLERSGEWYRVRTRSGATGYVSARWVEPPAPAMDESPSKASAPSPRVETRTPALGVGHKDVGCVVAGRYPRLEACFTPAEAVGRAQVQFRADENGPWFSVDMKGEGNCHSALLPKPTKKIERFHYFIEVVDRSFAMVVQPGAAPDRSYAPRVVSRESDCEQGVLVATGTPNASVVVNVARDASGKALQAGTASLGGTPASLGGFSMDGVTIPGSASSAASTVTASGPRGGSGLRIAVIGAGVLAAGGAAVAVAGGGDSASPDGGGPPDGIAGRWVGTFEETKTFVTGEFAGLVCPTSTRELTVNFVQSGSSVTGDFRFGAGVAPGPCANTRGSTTLTPEPNAFPLTGTASGGALTLQAGSVTLTGTYSGSSLAVSGTYGSSGGGESSTFLDRWTLTRQ